MRFLSVTLINLFITICFINSSVAQMKTGPQGSEGSFYREQAYHLPLKGVAGQRVAALIFRPPQDVPRPLLILTHGTEASGEKNKEWKVGYYPHAIDFFMQQGFVVALVHRRGYGLTGGSVSEGFSCERPNHLRSLQNSNLDLTSVIEGLTRLPFVKEKGIVLVGQSTGGWAVLGFGALNEPRIAATINFAGGRRGISHIDKKACALEELVHDAGVLGKISRTKSLWIYAKNDQVFSEDIVLRLQAAYKQGGAPLEFHMIESFGRDGHSLFPNPRGLPLWRETVKSFLEKL